jgi:hypothetical protein
VKIITFKIRNFYIAEGGGNKNENEYEKNNTTRLAYTNMNPGNPADARKIFINDATNGDPEKSGWMWDVRFDASVAFF